MPVDKSHAKWNFECGVQFVLCKCDSLKSAITGIIPYHKVENDIKYLERFLRIDQIFLKIEKRIKGSQTLQTAHDKQQQSMLRHKGSLNKVTLDTK